MRNQPGFSLILRGNRRPNKRNMKSKLGKFKDASIEIVQLASLLIAKNCTPFYEKRLLDRTEDSERRPHHL